MDEEKPKKKYRVFHRSKKTDKAHRAAEVAPQSSAKEGVCWPETFLPSLISNCRILTWGYDADVTHFFKPASGNTAFQHALNLLAEIERHRRGSGEVIDRANWEMLG